MVAAMSGVRIGWQAYLARFGKNHEAQILRTTGGVTPYSTGNRLENLHRLGRIDKETFDYRMSLVKRWGAYYRDAGAVVRHDHPTDQWRRVCEGGYQRRIKRGNYE
jgi:hypothetical protein